MSDDLKPCPFCGEAQPPHDDTSWVRCLGCGAETGWRPTGDEAIAAWNTRTPDTSIEALTAERDEHWKSFVHWRKEADALNEQLEAARADAKEAEAYAEGLERDLKTCRMAQVVMDNTVAALEAKLSTCEEIGRAFEEDAGQLRNKLEKAVEGLQGSRETILQLVNSRGSEAEGTDEDWVGDIDTTLAEIYGEKG